MQLFLLAYGCSQDAERPGGVCSPCAEKAQDTLEDLISDIQPLSKWLQSAKSTKDLVLLKNADSVVLILLPLSPIMFVCLGATSACSYLFSPFAAS